LSRTPETAYEKRSGIFFAFFVAEMGKTAGDDMKSETKLYMGGFVIILALLLKVIA